MCKYCEKERIIEEKKAIEYLKRHILPYYGSKGRIEFMLNDIILNLIEKQSKEIETLKKENLEIRDWKYTIDTIEDLDKLKELDLIKIKGKEYISKDKIKAKMKEKEWALKNYDSDESDSKQSQAIGAWVALQSLLEEE